MQDEPLSGRILIVDDVAANVRLLASILSLEGYDTVTATSGDEALLRAADSAPDVILLDVMMPGMDGFEVCRRLRADEVTAHIPVIMVTALQGTEDRVRALEIGADDFLSKPVDGVEVLARVRSLIRSKRNRDELRNAYAELQRAENLRENLTVMLIHDLRTPLTTLIGPIEMLLDKNSDLGPLTEVQEEILSLSVRSGYRLLELVNELLDISKLENGELRPDKEPVDVYAIVSEAMESGTLATFDHELEIRSEIPANLPRVFADDELLRRVVTNIVGNALKFTPSPGCITVGARVAEVGLVNAQYAANAVHFLNGSYVDSSALDGDGTTFQNTDGATNTMLFYVTDTGPGIPEADRARIFDKFGQVDIRKEGRKISTGLGLTFCKMAIEAHGGLIWVESEPDQGSTFFFTVPLADTPS